MKKLLLLPILFLTILNSQVICDKFDVYWSYANGILNISISTDLPSDTELTIYGSRSYILKENKETYGIDYFDTKESVAYWKSEHQFEINNEHWKIKLDEDLKKKAIYGLGSRYKSINNNVEVRIIVTRGQSNPLFGKNNSNLSGKMVTKDWINIVEHQFHIPLPLKGNPKIVSYVNANSLKSSNTYIIPKKIPLMMEFEANINDVSDVANNFIWLKPGYKIEVIKIQYKRNVPWYQVKAMKKNGKLIENGWINSIALLGETIKIDRRKK